MNVPHATDKHDGRRLAGGGDALLGEASSELQSAGGHVTFGSVLTLLMEVSATECCRWVLPPSAAAGCCHRLPPSAAVCHAPPLTALRSL